MPDGQPYTLESANFMNIIKTTVTQAENDIASIETDIANLTSKFHAEIQSRMARKADLELIVNHGSGLIGMVEQDAKNVETIIETALSTVLEKVGSDLSDFGAMLGLNPVRKAPQLAKRPEVAAHDGITPVNS